MKFFTDLQNKLEEYEFWKLILLYYKKFEETGNSVMDDLEGHVKKRKLEFFAQTNVQYQQIISDVISTLIIAFLVYYFINYLRVEWPFSQRFMIKYDEMPLLSQLNLSRLIIYQPLKISIASFSEKTSRTYNPLKFTLFILYPLTLERSSFLPKEYFEYKPLNFILTILYP